MAYHFTFERMTIGDLNAIIRASQAQDTPAFMDVLDRLTVGGVLDLPYTEMSEVIKQFDWAFRAYMQTPIAPLPEDVVHILRQALGGSQVEE